MPTYDYKCVKCKKVFEVEHKMKDVQMKFCPDCGGELKQVFHPVGVVFKGSGFYATDHRKEGKSSIGGSASGGKEEKGKDSKTSKS